LVGPGGTIVLTTPPVTAEAAIDTLAVLDAARISASEGRSVLIST